MARRFRMRFKKNVSVKSGIKYLASVILTLYIGGMFLLYLSRTMIGKCSPFFTGLQLLGWKVGSNATATAAGVNAGPECEGGVNYILYDISDAGVLVVVGLVAVGAVLFKFIDMRW